MEAIIHIGGEKTGTTTIQEFLARNRERLISHGVLYPACLGSPNHVKLAAYCLADPKTDDLRQKLGLTTIEKVESFRTDLRQELQKEIATHREISTILISNEHLQSRLVSIDEVMRLREFILEFAQKIHILLYIRRQDRLAVSAYSTALKAGFMGNSGVFPVIRPGGKLPGYYDYNATVDRYAELFGFDNVSVKVFETSHLKNGDIIEDFSFFCQFHPAWSLENVTRQNEALSETGIQFLQRFNEAVPPYKNNQQNSGRTAIVSDIAKRFNGKGPRVNKSDAEAFFESFRDSNRKLSGRYFPDMKGELFDTDFSDYDRVGDDTSSSQELIDFSIELWKQYTKELVESKLNVFLRDFLIYCKYDINRRLKRYPRLGVVENISPKILYQYIGCLLYLGEYHRVCEIIGFLDDHIVNKRPILIVLLVLSLLRAGESSQLDVHIAKYTINKKFSNCLSTMRDSNISSCSRDEWIDRLKSGGDIMTDTYEKCLEWVLG